MRYPAFGSIRLLLIIPALLFGWLIMPANQAHAAGAILLNPTSGPPGTGVNVTGTGYGATEAVNVSFGGTLLGTATTSPSGVFMASFNVPGFSALGTYTVTGTGLTSGISASALFTVTTGPSPGSGGPFISKCVSVNGGPCVTNVNANPGDTLVYDVSYGNSGTVGTGTVGTGTSSVTDALQPGQQFVSVSGSNCSYSSGGTGMAAGPPGDGTVSCSFPQFSGGRGDIFITTRVLLGFAGTIPNLASLSSTSTGVIRSNSTNVSVAGQIAPIVTAFNGLFTICGLVTAYTPPGFSTSGAITINGQTFAIMGGGSVTGLGSIPGNYCLVINFTNAVISSIQARFNLAGVNVVCGFVGAGSLGFLVLNGFQFPIASGTVFPIGIYPGSYVCFLLNGGGAVSGVLSSVPTSAHPVGRPAGTTSRLMRMD